MADNIKPIYAGTLDDFVWVGLGSGSGTNLRECAKIIKPKLIFSDKPAAGLLNLAEFDGIEKRVLNGFEACGSYKKAEAAGPDAIAEYMAKSRHFNESVAELLHDFEDEIGKPIDLIILGGYMRFVMDPLLTLYKDKMINVHPADLCCRDGVNRLLTGGDAVFKALSLGYTTTSSSVIIVDKGEDHGEILTQGPTVAVTSDFPGMGWSTKLRDYVDDPKIGHQARQKQISDWPALTTALRLIADGRLALGTEKVFSNEWRRVYLDRQPLEYHGHRVRS
jgi:folate-dependent phosphoribosylglycinamide formyltransferase PurN